MAEVKDIKIPGTVPGAESIKQGDVLFDRVEADLAAQLAQNAAELAVEGAGGEGGEVTTDVNTGEDGTPTKEGELLKQEPLGEGKTTTTDVKGDEGVDKKAKETPSPDDPKYKAAVEAKERMDQVLADNGYDSLEDLLTDLKSGKDIKDLIGSEDVEQLITDAKTKRAWEAHWAKENEKTQREKETPEETIARLDRENTDLKKAREEEAGREEQKKQSREAINLYQAEVDKILGAEEVSDEEKQLIKHIMGVDNPAFDIDDITDRPVVRKTVKEMLQTVRTLVTKIEQRGIDNYVKGKSKALPLSKTQGSVASKSVAGKLEFKGKNEGEILDEAKQALIELFTPRG